MLAVVIPTILATLGVAARSGPEQLCECHEEINREDDEVAHATNGTPYCPNIRPTLVTPPRGNRN